jgi:hypothetical protein
MIIYPVPDFLWKPQGLPIGNIEEPAYLNLSQFSIRTPIIVTGETHRFKIADRLVRRVGSLFEKLVGGSNFLEEMADHSPSHISEKRMRRYRFLSLLHLMGSIVNWADRLIQME